MFDHKHYVPMLKAKAGEFRAIKDVPAAARAFITPLFEVVPIPWDFEHEQPDKTLQQHLHGLPRQIERHWGTEAPFFIDLLNVAEDDTVDDGRTAIRYVLDECRSTGVKAIPVTGPQRGANYQGAVADAARTDQRGACIRVGLEEMGEPQEVVQGLSDVVAVLGLPFDSVDVLLDFESISRPQVGLVVAQAAIIADAVAGAGNWRTLTMASGAFPDTLTGFAANTIGLIPRHDWAAWQSLVARNIARKPAFADYGITGVAFTEVDPRIMRMSANVRYTTPDAWLILKGRNTRDHGFEQFGDLCRILVARTEWAGAEHCAGDGFIAACARPGGNTGNATTWRQVGTNHHLTTVAEAISSLSDS